MTGIGSHTKTHRGASDDWITPKRIIEALGPFDLDPCACNPQPWRTATLEHAPPIDGLAEDWRGRVWLNLPYGPATGVWLKRLAHHPDGGTALVFARTETKMFTQYVWPFATAVLFIEGRLHFHYPDGRRAKGNSGGPSVLIAYGEYDADRLRKSAIHGAYLETGNRGTVCHTS